jgi:hypothetical protein
MTSELAPIASGTSIFIMGGRVRSATPAITEAQDAERLGFERVWMCERYNLKEAGVVLSACALSTSRIQVAPGPARRRPTNSTANSMSRHAREVCGQYDEIHQFNESGGSDGNPGASRPL